MAGLPRSLARLPHIRGPVIAAVLLAGGWPAASASTYRSVRLFGTDYVDARDFARRFGLEDEWIIAKKKMRLRSRWTTIEFAVDSVEVRLNRLRLFLGEPVVAHRGSLYLGRRDVEAMLGSILSPRLGGRPPALKTIVVDPGHGGGDPGNQNTRLKLDEKVHTLDVAKRLVPLLREAGYRVILTRSTDRRVDLDERTAIAKRAGADLFISLHFNAFKDARVGGTETYVMPPRYQRSSPAAERTRSMVSTKYPSNRFDSWNILLGYRVHRALVERLQLKDRGLKRFRYRVLCTAECPAVLVEAAFLSNTAEGRKIATGAYRQQIATGIATGVKAYGAALEQLRSGR